MQKGKKKVLVGIWRLFSMFRLGGHFGVFIPCIYTGMGGKVCFECLFVLISCNGPGERLNRTRAQACSTTRGNQYEREREGLTALFSEEDDTERGGERCDILQGKGFLRSM